MKLKIYIQLQCTSGAVVNVHVYKLDVTGPMPISTYPVM